MRKWVSNVSHVDLPNSFEDSESLKRRYTFESDTRRCVVNKKRKAMSVAENFENIAKKVEEGRAEEEEEKVTRLMELLDEADKAFFISLY